MMVKKNVRPNPQRNIKGGIAEQNRSLPSLTSWWCARAVGRHALDINKKAAAMCVSAAGAMQRWTKVEKMRGDPSPALQDRDFVTTYEPVTTPKPWEKETEKRWQTKLQQG